MSSNRHTSPSVSPYAGHPSGYSRYQPHYEQPNLAFQTSHTSYHAENSFLERLQQQNASLNRDNARLEGKLEIAERNYEELLKKINTVPSQTNGLATKVPSKPLQQEDYPDVRFWTEKSYERSKQDTGDTDGMATSKPRRGRPSNDDDSDQKHPYLEDESGSPVERSRITKFGEKARRLFNSLKTNGLDRSRWKDLDDQALDYIQYEMEHEFEEFRLCEGSWKLATWAPRVYASWMHNVKAQNGTSRTRTKRRRSSSLKPPAITDDTTLIKMDDMDTQPELPSDSESTSKAMDQATPGNVAAPMNTANGQRDTNIATQMVTTTRIVDILDDDVLMFDLDNIERSTAEPRSLITVPITTSASQTSPPSATPTPTTTVPEQPLLPPPPNESAREETTPSPDDSTTICPSPSDPRVPAAQHVIFSTPLETGSLTLPIPVDSPVLPLIPIQNSTTTTTRALKKVKLAPLATVGKGLTDKNFAMKDWLATNPGGSKADFETYFKNISPTARKAFEAQAKQAKKVAGALKLAEERVLAASQGESLSKPGRLGTDTINDINEQLPTSISGHDHSDERLQRQQVPDNLRVAATVATAPPVWVEVGVYGMRLMLPAGVGCEDHAAVAGGTGKGKGKGRILEQGAGYQGYRTVNVRQRSVM
ncbi:hypothetical protein FPV67DRAFT_1698212 [Lyophyllum atratum]|nr:hypothetical protein FPV67DRAFT_1698212 [Lyophyllum atratum]